MESKILYDIVPMGYNEDDRHYIQNKGYTCMAVCAKSDMIINALKKIILSEGNMDVVAWTSSYEESIDEIKNNLADESQCLFKEAELVGIFRHNLPQLVFNLKNSDIDYIIKNFDQILSLKMFVLKSSSSKKDFIKIISKEMDRNRGLCIDSKDLLDSCELIINKSGDEDELEIILKKENVDGVLKLFF